MFSELRGVVGENQGDMGRFFRDYWRDDNIAVRGLGNLAHDWAHRKKGRYQSTNFFLIRNEPTAQS